jgi:hypothetical protein
MLVILAFLGGAIIGALALAVVSEDDNFEQLGHIDELSADGGDLIPQRRRRQSGLSSRCHSDQLERRPP